VPTRQRRKVLNVRVAKTSSAGRRQKARELSWVAHHEAAHAVVGLRLRPGSGSGATIVPSGDTLGRASTEDVLFSGRRDQRTGMLVPDARAVEAVIVELLAGRLGAARAGCPAALAESMACGDEEKVADLLQFTPRTRTALRRKALRFVEREWKAIAAVAQELLEHGILDDVEIELLADLTRPQKARAELVRYRQIHPPHRPTWPVPENA